MQSPSVVCLQVLRHTCKSESAVGHRDMQCMNRLCARQMRDCAGPPGWGFTDCGFGQRADVPLGPEQKREHLFAFWQAKA